MTDGTKIPTAPSERAFDYDAWLEEIRREPRLVRNAVRCLSCDTVIESRYAHDFVTCPCRRVSVDGGLYYNRVLFTGDGDVTYEDLSAHETPEQVAERLSSGPDES